MTEKLKLGTLLALIILGLVLFVLALARLFGLVVLILIAIVLTTGIDPLVSRLQRRLARPLATFLVMLLGLLIIGGAITFLVDTAVNQALNFYHNTKLQGDIYHFWAEHLSKRFPFIPRPEAVIRGMSTQSGQIGGYLWSTTQALFGVLGTLFSFITVFILTFFFTTFRQGITHNFSQLIPPPYQPRAREVSHLVALKMGGWLRGQLTLAGIITSAVGIFMALIGFPGYAILLGIMGGVGELIPLVGPYLAFLPALLVVLTLGGQTWQIVAVIVFFIILSQMENYVLAPRIMASRVGLHPISIILAVITGGSLLGILGALLAIPLTAGGRVIMLEVVFPAIQHKTPQEIASGQPDAAELEQEEAKDESSPGRSDERSTT